MAKCKIQTTIILLLLLLTGRDAWGQVLYLHSSVAFGNVGVGVTGRASFSVSTGGIGWRLYSVSVSGTGFSTLTHNESFNGGVVYTHYVNFTPSVVGIHTGTLTFEGEFTNSPFSVSFTATGVVAPTMTLSPSSLAFGDVEVGSSLIQTVEIKNSSVTSLTISSIAISGTGFTLPSSTAITIANNKSAGLSVQFKPINVGTNYTGTVTLTHNAVGSPTTIALTGKGIIALPKDNIKQKQMTMGDK
jgi:hypothetical protein